MFDLGRKTIGCLGSCATSFVLAVLAYTISAPGEAAAQKLPAVFPGSIHSYVAADLSPLIPVIPAPRALPSAPGDPIFVSDIDVWAKNINTGVTSPLVITNPSGYFRTPELPAGDYQICVSGTGYTTTCDTKTISVTRPVVALDHIVLIRPAADAISGTVTLADRTTPCFWFRPSVSPQALTAKVSLLDGNGNVVAGPVNGNNWGQYVLPATLGAGNLKLHAACDSGVAAGESHLKSWSRIEGAMRFG